MKLTGKALEAFGSWLTFKCEGLENQTIIENEDDFWELPDSFKWGVLVDFFEGEGMIVYVKSLPDGRWSVYVDDYCSHLFIDYLIKDKSAEARNAAIEKANEILNKRLDELEKA